MCVSVSFLGCVYQLPVNGSTSARRPCKSNSLTEYERPMCR